MKVIAIMGSARKKHSFNALQYFFGQLGSRLDANFEILRLSEYNIAYCRGCKTCIDRGEEFCPLEDDSAGIIKKMLEADAVLFVSPNYSFHVSGMMKSFFDHCAYLCHRPAMFGKVSSSITVQGIYGGKKIASYFDFIARAMGFNTVKGIVINSLEPMTEKQEKKNRKELDIFIEKFRRQLLKNKLKHPNLFELMIFRMSRSKIQSMLDENYRDYSYFKEKGWFSSDFYYPVRLNPIEKLFGRMIDKINFSGN